MKFLKTRNVLPVDRSTFRKSLLQYFGWQLVLIAVFLGFMNSDYQHHVYAVHFIFGLLAIFSIVSFFGLKHCDYSGRFKDIYPGYELKNWYLLFLGFLPLVFFLFALFLCLQGKPINKKPWKIFTKLPAFLMLALPLLAIQTSSPKVAYWVASPSLYYIVDVLYGTQKILALKEELDKSPGYVSAVDQYLGRDKNSLNATKLVLLTAVSASNVLEKKPEEKFADDMRKIETNVNYSILLLKETNKMISLSETTGFNFLDYSVAQWIHPSGIIEIILLTGVERAVKDKFNQSIVDRTVGIVQNLENGFTKLPASTQDFYRPEIKKIKNELMNSQTYKLLSVSAEK